MQIFYSIKIIDHYTSWLRYKDLLLFLTFSYFYSSLVSENGGVVGVSGSNPGKTTKLLGNGFDNLVNFSIELYDDNSLSFPCVSF